MSGNGGQKNVIVAKDFAPNDRLWIHPLVLHPPPPPPAINLVAKRESFPPTHSVQNSTFFGVKRGFVAVINTDITGKIQPLLTSNVPK